jgi:hypothetical protein
MAIAQSRQVARMITMRTGLAVEIIGLSTLGDVSRAQLTQIGDVTHSSRMRGHGSFGRGPVRGPARQIIPAR